MGQRSFAVVANGDDGADGDVLGGWVQMNIEIEVSEGDGLALGVGGGGRVTSWPRLGRRGRLVVVVWPLSSVEREKMTVP